MFSDVSLLLYFLIHLVCFCNIFRRDAYTVIAPDEQKRKMLQESKSNCSSVKCNCNC